jgi:hypothetical protein
MRIAINQIAFIALLLLLNISCFKKLRSRTDTKYICIEVSSIDNSGTTNTITLNYYKENSGHYQCTMYGLNKGETKCCDAAYKGTFTPSQQSTSGNPIAQLVISGGSDGLRVTGVKAEGYTEDKWYNGALHGYLDGYLSGTCFKRFWVDNDAHGRCDAITVNFFDHFSSSNGNCSVIVCSETPYSDN